MNEFKSKVRLNQQYLRANEDLADNIETLNSRVTQLESENSTLQDEMT